MEVILRYPCKRDLSHQLAPEAELIVGIGQIGERPEGRIAGAGDHRVDILKVIEHGVDRRRIFKIDFNLTVAGRMDDLVLACRERLGDLDADSAGSSDNDNFHESCLFARLITLPHLKPIDRHMSKRLMRLETRARARASWGLTGRAGT